MKSYPIRIPLRRRCDAATRPFAATLAIALGLFALLPAGAVFAKQDPRPGGEEAKEDPRIRGRLVLRFTEKTGDLIVDQYLAGRSFDEVEFPDDVADLLTHFEVTDLQPIVPLERSVPSALQAYRERFPERSRRSRTESLPRIDHIFVAFSASRASLDEIEKAFRSASSIRYAHHDARLDLHSVADDLASLQWGLDQINAGAAWSSNLGAGVTIGVLDTGIGPHGDLSSNLWLNGAEAGGLPLNDDDGNGFVDDLHGWNFVLNSPAITDPHGHGSHVAGIAGAACDGCGTVGVAPQVSLMPLTVIDAGGGGGGLLTHAFNAIIYACGAGADVLNMSWGYAVSLPPFPLNAAETALLNAIELVHGLGVVSITSAGNSATMRVCNAIPGRSEYGLSIGASNAAGTVADYSSWGSLLDGIAPGGTGSTAPMDPAHQILSTVPTGSDYATNRPGTPSLSCPARVYVPDWGTSMSAPHVAAVAALLIHEHPTWTVEEIRQALRFSSTDVDTWGFGLDSGWGRIDAAAAMSLPANPRPTANVTRPGNCQILTGNSSVDGFAEAVSGPGRYVVQVGEGMSPTSWATIGEGATNVTDAALANWDPTCLRDGDVAVRVVTWDGNNRRAEDRNALRSQTGSTTSCCVTPPAGMHAWWTLDELSSNVYSDTVGNNWGEGRGGIQRIPGFQTEGAEWDGINDSILFHDRFPLHDFNTLTVDFWMRADDLVGTQTLMEYEDGYRFDLLPGGGIQIAFRGTGPGGCVENAGAGTNTLTFNSTGISANTWHHITVRVNLDIELWVDGALLGSGIGNIFVDNRRCTPGDWSVGSNLAGGNPFDGEIDEIEIFERALSSLEINSLAGAGSYGKCKTCPDESDPNVVYASRDPYACNVLGVAVACSASMGGSAFNDHCGCGCVFSNGGSGGGGTQ